MNYFRVRKFDNFLNFVLNFLNIVFSILLNNLIYRPLPENINVNAIIIPTSNFVESNFSVVIIHFCPETALSLEERNRARKK